MKRSFSFLILFAILSCSEIYNLESEEQESTLVIESSISAQKGVRVYITRTYPVGMTFRDSDKYAISEASISLYNSAEIRVDSLIAVESGIYVSSDSLAYDLNDKYRLEISHDDFPTATTGWVSIPHPFVSLDTSVIISNDTVTVDVSFNLSSENEADISFGFDQGSDSQYFINLPILNPDLENCEAVRFPYKNLSIFKQECFSGNRSTFQDKGYRTAENIEITYFLGLVSQEARIFYRSINSQPIEFEQIVSAPILTEGNVINGEGVFYGVYEYEIKIPL